MNVKKQIILFLGICIVISLTLIFVFLLPLFSEIKNDSLELVGIKKELTMINEKTKGINDIKKTCNAIDYNLEKSENLFVNLEIPVSLIEFLENSADNLNLLSKISPVFLKEVKDDIWDFVGFRLTIAGPYDGLMRFLVKIESAPFLIEAQDLSIRILTDSELSAEDYKQFDSGDVLASLTIKSFGK